MSPMTTTSKKLPHRNRFSRNTVAIDIGERIRELEELFDQADMVDANYPPTQRELVTALIDELKRLLDRWGLEKP